MSRLTTAVIAAGGWVDRGHSLGVYCVQHVSGGSDGGTQRAMHAADAHRAPLPVIPVHALT